MLFSGTQTVS